MTSIKGKNKKDKPNPFAGVTWTPTPKSGSTQPTQPVHSNPYLQGVSGTWIESFGGHTPNNPAGLLPDDLATALSNQGGNNFGTQLARFSQNSDISELLNALAIAGKGDWNKQLLETLLNYMLTTEQRGYNESLRDEQRLYDTPMNQLARLMGSGISRDAAIQLLGGSASGSGSAVPYGEAQQMSAGIPDSQSKLNSIQGKTAIANTVFNGVQTVASLMSMGFSAPSAIQQASLLGVQAQMSQKQLGALNSADAVTGAIGSLVQTGQLTQETVDSWSNADDAIKHLNGMKDNPQVAQLLASPDYASVYGSQLGREAFNKSWKNLRSSRDDGTLLDHYIRQQELANMLTSADISKIGAEMEVLGTQNKLYEQQIVESCNRVLQGQAQIEVLNKQGKYIAVQTESLRRMTDSQVNLMDTQAYGQDIQNNMNQQQYEYNSVGFPMMKLARQHAIQFELTRWQCATTPTALRAMQEKWLQDPINARDAAYLLQIRNNAVGSFAQEYPELYRFAAGFSESGIDNLVKVTAGVAAEFTPAGRAINAAKHGQ